MCWMDEGNNVVCRVLLPCAALRNVVCCRLLDGVGGGVLLGSVEFLAVFWSSCFLFVSLCFGFWSRPRPAVVCTLIF